MCFAQIPTSPSVGETAVSIQCRELGIDVRTEGKLCAIAKAIPEESELKQFLNADRYTISNKRIAKATVRIEIIYVISKNM